MFQNALCISLVRKIINYWLEVGVFISMIVILYTKKQYHFHMRKMYISKKIMQIKKKKI